MPSVLVTHLAGIADKEGITVEPEALALIARAAEGSVRDSLSLLDQAIAHAAGPVRAEDVRQMLGLADRTRTIDLFEAVMRGDMAAALAELRDQYDTGADPAVVLADLAEFTHFVTRVKIVPAVADDVSLAEAERTRGRAFAEKLSMRVLSRAWQMLLKGIAEVEEAGRPVAAAEMVLVRHRLCGRPADARRGDPLARRRRRAPQRVPQGNGGDRHAAAASAARRVATRVTCDARARRAARQRIARGAPRPADGADRCSRRGAAAAPPLAIGRFEELVALAAQKRDICGQGRARARRAAGALRGRPARDRAGAERHQDAGQRSVRASSRNGPAGAGWWWSPREPGAADRARRRTRRGRPSSRPACAPIRWCRRCWRAFPGAEIVGVRAGRAAAQRCRAGEPDDAMPEPPPVDDDSGYGADWRPDDQDDD